MNHGASYEQLLELAILQEQIKADFYALIADQAGAPGSIEILKNIIREERAHKAKLEFIKSTGEIKSVAGQIIDLKISDYLEVLPPPDLTYSEALELAMNKEKMAFKLYSALAANAPSDPLRTAFSTLALEEASHKLQFEIAYDDLIEDSESK
jgi:rubrerythrin